MTPDIRDECQSTISYSGMNFFTAFDEFFVQTFEYFKEIESQVQFSV